MSRMSYVGFLLLFIGALSGFISDQVLAAISFQDASSSAGFKHSGETYGASWGDFNRDGYPDLFVSNHREWAALYRNNRDGTFTDVILTADGSGIWKSRPKHDNHGASFSDYDGDGDMDMYVTTGGADRGLLLVNENNIFFDRAVEYGVEFDVEGRLPVWVDIANDGRLDLALMIRSASRLFRPKDLYSPNFSNQTLAAGFDCVGMDYGQLADFDNDGTQELICGNGTFPRRVYDVTTYPFSDVTSTVDAIPRGTDSAVADFDGDMDLDVFVIAGKKIPSQVELTSPSTLEAAVGVSPGSDKGFTFSSGGDVTFDVYVKRQIDRPEKVYIGAGGIHPADMSFTLNSTDPSVQGMFPYDPAVDSGVYIGFSNNQWRVMATGLEDHAVGGYFSVASTDVITGLTMVNLEVGDFPERPYYLDNVSGVLVEDGATRGLVDDVSCISVTSGDYDNDGDVDLYVVCRGGVENLANRVYENNGDGTFSLVVGPHGAEGVLGFHLASKAGLGDSAVTADYDLDGCLDVFVTNGLPLQPGRHDSGPDQIFRNDCSSGNRWIQLDLYGGGIGASNPDGIGAKVFVTAGGVTQVRERNGGYHRWSQDQQRLHFGLAGNETVDLVEVVWPSGLVETFNAVPSDQIYELREGTGSLDPVLLGGGEFQPAQLGDECGIPEFDARVHEGVFVWKDCTTGVWSMRTSAGWSSYTAYSGSVISDGNFVFVTDEGLLEGADELDSSVAGQIRYSFGLSSGGRDGFSFELASGASGCFDVEVPGETQVLLGAGSIPAQLPLDLNTLGVCATLSDLTVGDVTVNEGDGTVTFTVSLSAASADEVQVGYATADVTATAPDDYANVTGGTLIIPAGDTSGEVVITIVDDNQPEGSQTFVLNLSDPVNAIIADASATATIEDNEAYACGEPSIMAATEKGVFLWQDCPTNSWHMRVTAGGPDKVTHLGQVTVLTDGQSFPSAPVEFSWEGADSVVSSDATIVYSLNVVKGGQDGFEFTLPAAGETCFEVTGPGDVQIHLGAGKDPMGTSLNLATLAPCTPPPALPELTVGDVTVNETDGAATFTVSLSAASADEVQVGYATADVTATAPDDYANVTGGTLIIPAGDTSGEVVITIVDDNQPEGSQTFVLNLSDPVNAIIADASATATIEDNEAYACGEPSIMAATEKGVFLWQDCPTNSWHMRVTAGGPDKVTHLGQVTVLTDGQSFPSAPVEFSWEGADSVVSSDATIVYSLNVVKGGQDGFEFTLPAAGETCFEVTGPGDVQIHLGAGKDPMGTSLNLGTLSACGVP